MPLDSVWLIGLIWFRVLIVPPTVATTSVIRTGGQSDLNHILNTLTIVWFTTRPVKVGDGGVVVGIAPDI